MSEEISQSQRILDAAETVLRRHGAEKTNVVDVARAMSMSHGNIYRHFPSKKALLNAVAHRWLEALNGPLDAIADDRSRPAATRLADWFDTLRKTKQRKLAEDPELFRLQYNVVQSAEGVIDQHLESMLGQIRRIITDGQKKGEFSRKLDPGTAARAFLQATTPFHHPAMIMQDLPPTEADAQAVLALLLAGLQATRSKPATKRKSA